MKKRRMIILFSILAFVAVAALLNSFVFSVREVRAHCFNSADEKLIKEVIDNSGIELYKNIIGLNEKKAVANIEAAMPDKVKVINIERKFPDKVWIHFVKLVPILAIEHDGLYVTCDNNLTVIETGVPETALMLGDPVDDVNKKPVDDPTRPMVLVKIKGSVISPAEKKPLELKDNNCRIALLGIVDTVNRLRYEEHDFVQFIKEIDLRDYDDAVNPAVIFKMRGSEGSAGVTIEIQNTKNLFLRKVQHAISAYEQYLAGEGEFANLKSTKWTVYNDSKNKIRIAAG